MGFLDKAKHFLGGHGVKVTNTVIEKQDPNAVQMPLTDTVVKGKFNVTQRRHVERHFDAAAGKVVGEGEGSLLREDDGRREVHVS